MANNPFLDGAVIGGVTYDYKDPNLTEEVIELKSAIEEEITLKNWVKGSFNSSTGKNETNTKRLRLDDFLYYETSPKVRSLSGYEFAVFAWNKTTGSYIGCLTTNRFGPSGTVVWATTFDLSEYPAYKFKFVLRNATTPTAEMQYSESANFLETISVFADRSDVETLSDLLYGEQISLTIVNGYWITTTGGFNSVSGAAYGYFPIQANQKYLIISEDLNAIRIGGNNTGVPESRSSLSGVINYTDGNRYVYTNANGYQYAYVNVLHPDYPNAKITVYAGETDGVIHDIQKDIEDLEGLGTAVTNLQGDVENDTHIKIVGECFESGSFNSGDGGREDNPARIRTYDTYDLNNTLSVLCSTGYEFAVFAWDKATGNYAGYLTSNGISKTASPVFVTQFDISNYSGYDFKFVLRNATTPTANMSLIEAYNFVVNEKINIQSNDMRDYTVHGNCKVNGKLTKNGVYVVNSSNVPVELRGVGLHALLQYKNLHTWKSFNSLKNMGVNVIRCSAYLQDVAFPYSDGETAYGYISHPNETKAEIDKIVKLCIDLGLYVIIDWHHWANGDGTIASYLTYAQEFFTYFAQKWANCPNVMYEILNEPYDDNVTSVANFVDSIRTIIKTYVTNPVMITGVGTKDTEGHALSTAYDRCVETYNALTALGITDVFVSPHSYPGNIYGQVEQLVDEDIPVFVTEWANAYESTSAHGSFPQSLMQLNTFHQLAVPHCVWKYTDQTMGFSLLNNRGVINSEKYSDGFSKTDLSIEGVFILGKFLDYATTEWIDRQPLT